MRRQGFLKSVLYIAALGILATPAGRMISKAELDPGRFPYRSLPFEREGKLYEKLGIRRWKTLVPDMSRYLTKILPPKQVAFRDGIEKLEVLIHETCVAECVHGLLCILGLGIVYLWPGPGGAVLAALYILLGNLPFILIQRYNRPRLLKLLEKKRKANPSATPE